MTKKLAKANIARVGGAMRHLANEFKAALYVVLMLLHARIL